MRNSLMLMVVAALAAPAGATTLQRLSLEDLTHESTAVVRGRVAEVRTEQAGPLLYTVARVEISNVWKGENGESIEVSSPGGVWQGAEQRFPGAPRLELGGEYVLFLWRGPSGRVQITGFSQGVFDVYDGPDGAPRVRREAVSSELLLPSDAGPQAASERMDLPLSEFDALLGAALAEEPGR